MVKSNNALNDFFFIKVSIFTIQVHSILANAVTIRYRSDHFCNRISRLDLQDECTTTSHSFNTGFFQDETCKIISEMKSPIA